MQFREIIGQDHVKRRLTKMVETGRIPHALMLIGPPGTGKRSLALATAQYLSCSDRQPGDSCGRCPSCIKFGKLVHPDLHFVVPVTPLPGTGPKTNSDTFAIQWREAFLANPYISENQWYETIGAENKQGIINVSESDSVTEKLGFKPYESEFRMMIIWLPERMNHQTANKLLKLIEEPPAKTVIIMASESTDRILPTIMSRTQILQVPPLPDDIIRQGLIGNYGADPVLLEDAVHRAGGNLNLALVTLARDEQENRYFDLFTKIMRLAYGRKIVEISDWVDEVAALGRERQKQLLDYSLRLIRENFMMHMDREELNFLTAKEKEFSVRFSPYIHADNVHELAGEFNLAANHIEANGYPKVIFMDLSIKLIMLLMREAPIAG